MSEEQLQLLHQARNRAERLVGELQSQYAEIEANPQMQQGRATMQNAIAAAQRTLAELNSAQGISSENQP